MSYRLIALCLLLCALGGCKKREAPLPPVPPVPMGFTGNPSYPILTPQNPGNVQGVDGGYPVAVTGSITATFSGGGVIVQNDAGNPVPADLAPGDLQSSVAHFVVATSAGVVADAGGTFVGATFCNAGNAGGWLQFYAQTTLDAGGTNDAGTAPLFMTPYVPALGCGSLQETQTFATGLTWYSSSTQGFLTVDAGVPVMTIDVVHR